MNKIVAASLLIALLQLAACAMPGARNAEVRGGKCKTLVETNREQFAETAQLLALTPIQQVLWESYQESVDALIGDQATGEASRGGRQTALQQIDAKVGAVRNQLSTIEVVARRAAALYQSLDAPQRRVADQQLAATVPAFYSGAICPVGAAILNEKGGRGAPGGGPGR